jgi:hypothetical protein
MGFSSRRKLGESMEKGSLCQGDFGQRASTPGFGWFGTRDCKFSIGESQALRFA